MTHANDSITVHLLQQPTRYKWRTWIHLGLLYTHEEMLERYDYVGGVWHERIVHVVPPQCKGYCKGCEAREMEQAK